MKNSSFFSAIMAATVFSIVACSPSTDDVAGIGGSGITSTGTITGFGSIFVNGIEFETPQNVTIDDNPSTDDKLALGMRVTVKGTINTDGVTGTADSVSYDDDIEGPVNNLMPVGNDGQYQTLTVLGRQVRISSTSTNFDRSDSLPKGTTFDFDTIANDNHVEISGFLDSSNALIATRVELKALTFNPASIVEIKGTITGLNGAGTSFNLAGVSGVNFNTSASTIIEDLPNKQLADDAFVEVKGTCNASCTTITATRIEGESSGFENDDDVELEGIITSLSDQDHFEVNGFPVDASNAEKEPAFLVLAEDMLVEVEGTVINNVLVASEVEQEGGEIKIAATVAAGTVNESTGSFDLEPLAGQTITIKIDNSTEIEDESGTITSLATLFINLNDSDYVVIEGYDNGTGTIIASEVKRKDFPGDVILEGVVTDTTWDGVSGSVTILGIEFPVDSATVFEDENDDYYMDKNDFFTDIQPLGSKIAKIKDKSSGGSNPIGIADEVDLED
jgi:hypothetical protein